MSDHPANCWCRECCTDPCCRSVPPIPETPAERVQGEAGEVAE